jgi:O-antigen/teichoic acid export membrane protein
MINVAPTKSQAPILTSNDASASFTEVIEGIFQAEEVPRVPSVSEPHPGSNEASETPVSRSNARGGIALAVAIGVSSALSFAVHALASRQLSIANYGALAAVLALMTAAAVPVGAIQTALTRSAAEILSARKRPSGRAIARLLIPSSIVLVLISALISPLVAAFLNLNSVVPVILGGSWVATVLLGSVGKALLIARSSHSSVAHAVVHGAIVRLAAAAVFTPFFGVSGGIAAAVIGDVVASAIYMVAARRRGMFSVGGVEVRVVWPDAGRALSSQLSLWIFASLAVVIGRRTLTGAESGSFAAMSTAAAACLFLPQAVATIVFPRFVADGARKLLMRATALATAVGTVCALMLSARPDMLFTLFFGPLYTAQRSVLLLLCSHFVFLGCLTVLTQYVVARRQGGTLAVWLALAVAVALAVKFGDSPMSVSISLVIPNAMVTLYIAYRGFFLSSADPARRELAKHVNVVPDIRPNADVHRFAEQTTEPATEQITEPATEPAAPPRRRLSDKLRRPATLDVSIVIPTYNGGDSLVPCVTAIRDTFDRTDYRYEIVVVVDGSTDESHQGLLALGDNIVVDLEVKNAGKGAALRRGFAQAHGRAIGFIDGDGDIAPNVLVDLVKQLQTKNVWVAVASKNAPGATVVATKRRRIMSAGYRMLVHWMFDLSVTDTQCGCKVFRREFLAETIDYARENGFALDLELLSIGSRKGFKSAVEVPVVLAREDVSTVSNATAIRMLIDTIRIRRRLPQATWEPLPLTTFAPVGLDYSSALYP